MPSNAETGDLEIDNAAPRRWRTIHIFFVIFSVLLFAAFTFQLWFHATRTSAVVDEPAHILAGHRYWQCKDYGINPEHPPLVKLLATAPLVSRSLVEPNSPCGAQITTKLDSFLMGNHFLAQNEPESVVVPTRLAASLLSLILAALVFLAAREMFGRWAALVALALVVFEPNLIAHGSLVTTDMALSATIAAVVYAIYRFRKKPDWLRFSLVAISFGFLLAAKHSALIFLPILFLILIADTVLFSQEKSKLPLQLLKQTGNFVVWVLTGFVMLWAFYGFQYYSIPNQTAGTVSIDNYIKEVGRPETINSSSTRLVRNIGKLGILPESYVVGMADIAATNSRNAWVLKRVYATGQWWYFPLAFLVKTSVALLLLLPIGLLMLAFQPEKRRELMFLLIPPIFYFAISLTSGMNLGVRHLLPIYPFLIIIAAAGSIALCHRFSVFRFLLAAILIFHAVAAVRVAPHYIAFSNDFFGGLNNTHQYFHDSSTDYGQNLKLPVEYARQNDIADCWFAGFGNYELVTAYQPCRVLPSGFTRLFGEVMVEPVPPIVEGTFFIAANELPPRGGNEYVPITQSQPIATLGGGVFVYQGRFEIPLAAAMSRTQRAIVLTRENRLDEAVAEARQATALFNEDPRPHLALANALFRQNQKDEARVEFAEAIRLTESNPQFFFNLKLQAERQLQRLEQN